MTVSGAAQHFSTATSIAKNEQPDVHSLISQNYPNPFNPSTTIRYGIPASSNVSVKVFNVLGQEVAELVNSVQPAGWHETIWNPQTASGVYLYRIEAMSTTDPVRKLTQIKKMMLIR
jgi:hypothetical protein